MGTLNDLCGLYSLLCYRSDEIIGSGSIATYNEKFFLLTCCHNFLAKADFCRREDLKDDYVNKKIKRNCKKFQYWFSTKNFKSTVALPAHVVLKNCKDPIVVFKKVGSIALSIEL